VKVGVEAVVNVIVVYLEVVGSATGLNVSVETVLGVNRCGAGAAGANFEVDMDPGALGEIENGGG
jgi:hypothetical protein